MREDNLGRRSVAAIIDLCVCIGVFCLVFYFFSSEVRRGGLTLHVISGVCPNSIHPRGLALLYPYTESCFQRTLGKFLCGLMIVPNRGGSLTFGQALLRRLADPLEVWFAFGLVGYLVISLSEDRRRLGDRVAETRVVRKKIAESEAIDPQKTTYTQ
jgi:uncharacterized RDD family membrane protein YckC